VGVNAGLSLSKKPNSAPKILRYGGKICCAIIVPTKITAKKSRENKKPLQIVII
jgi:hypothetical protein